MNKDLRNKMLKMVLTTGTLAALMSFGRMSLASSSKRHKHSAQQKDIHALLLAVVRTANKKSPPAREDKYLNVSIGHYEYLCDRHTGRVIQKVDGQNPIVDGWIDVFVASVGIYTGKGKYVNPLQVNSKYARDDAPTLDAYLMHCVNGKWLFVDDITGFPSRSQLHRDGLSDALIKKLGIDTGMDR